MNLPPERIVTLLPSATEILCELGLRDRLVGVTHECDYPAGVSHLPHVTSSRINPQATSAEIDLEVRNQLDSNQSLYTINAPLLASLKPDLLVTQTLCDVCAVAEDDVAAIIHQLPTRPKVINLEPMTLIDVFDTITQVGQATAIEPFAFEYREKLQSRMARVQAVTNAIPLAQRPTVGFLEWIDPLFNAGHWTPEIIELAGGIDSFGNKHQPSQSIPDTVLQDADPDVLIVALCGFDAARSASDLENLKNRIDYESLSAVRNGRVHILDGNGYFSRPGPRLIESLEVLAGLLHPELFPTA